MKENIKLILLFILVAVIAGTKVYDVLAENSKAEEAAEKYRYCIQATESENVERWNEQCYKVGLDENCFLPAASAETLNQLTNSDRLGCLRHYMK